LSPSRSAAPPRYQAYYCEENVWHLAGEVSGARWALVISNPERAVALWRQRAGRPPDGFVVWDYHVALLVQREPGSLGGAGWWVADLDTLAGSPLPLAAWLRETFRPLPAEWERLSPRFRLVDAARYRAEFSSERSHMRRADGTWLQPPPPWPAIDRPGAPSFLRWTVMGETGDDSLSLAELERRFSKP
jgi:protein N-terminal glutamine amidohydrolase